MQSTGVGKHLGLHVLHLTATPAGKGNPGGWGCLIPAHRKNRPAIVRRGGHFEKVPSRMATSQQTAAQTPQACVVPYARRDVERIMLHRSGMTGGVLRPLSIVAITAGALACNDAPFAVPSEPIDAPFIALSAGALHTCGVTVSGRAYCWGWNRDGELGDGSKQDQGAPGTVAGSLTVTTVAAGGGHTCAATVDALSYCWGFNLSGQLGDGSNATRTVPHAVTGGLDLAVVAAGGAYSCALAADSAAYCWGWGSGGQLGDGARADRAAPSLVGGSLKFVALSPGTRHTCGLAADSTAYCWGMNDFGQLGDGTTTDTTLPVRVTGGLKYRALVSGYQHSCGLLVDGHVHCWGDASLGQLGDSTLDTFTFTALAAGAAHTCGLAVDSTAYCWGADGSAQLGSQPAEWCNSSAGQTPCTPAPTAVATSLKFVQLTGGAQHSCGLTKDHVAFCWGLNNHGQLGNGSTAGSVTPVRVANQ